MKNINFKKFLPGLVSVVIIAGMAAQSFATNVDMAAFVKKEKYMTKYYELDWRIDEIDKYLERLYKFTCTNVKTWAGGTPSLITRNPWLEQNTTRNRYHQQNPVAEFSDSKYLRVNGHEALNAFVGHNSVDKFVFEIPASCVIWREGIEIYPETKMKINASRSWVNTSIDVNQNPSWTYECIMGPFKKFPHITDTSWNASSICIIKNWTVIMSTSNGGIAYQQGTRTEPTSWSQMSSGSCNWSTTSDEGTVFTKGFPNLTGLRPSLDYYSNNIYSLGKRAILQTEFIYFNNTPSVNLSTYKDIWLKFTYSVSNTYQSNLDLLDWTLTTWNNNK